MTEIPSSHRDLLERPTFGHLGTLRPDGRIQVNPMWFLYDGTHIRFTHTSKRAKFRNLEFNPAMTLSITDPDQPYRYIELRGRLSEVIPDPNGEFYQELSRRYGSEDPPPPPDAPDRVILVMDIEALSIR